MDIRFCILNVNRTLEIVAINVIPDFYFYAYYVNYLGFQQYRYIHLEQLDAMV